MRTVKQLVDIVTFLTREPRGRVNQMARRLMDDGLLPKSIGRNVKNVDSSAAFLPVFAIAFAKRAADASAVANKIADLTLLTPQPADPDMLDLLKKIGIHVGSPLADLLGRFIASDMGWECELEIRRGDDERYGADFVFWGEMAMESYWVKFGYDHSDVGFTWQSFHMGEQGFKSMRTLFRAKDPPDIPGLADTAKDEGGDG